MVFGIIKLSNKTGRTTVRRSYEIKKFIEIKISKTNPIE